MGGGSLVDRRVKDADMINQGQASHAPWSMHRMARHRGDSWLAGSLPRKLYFIKNTCISSLKPLFSPSSLRLPCPYPYPLPHNPYTD